MKHLFMNADMVYWNYPLTVDRFKVYGDTDPYGTYSNLVRTLTGNVILEPIGSNPVFYRVVAERDAIKK